MKTDKKNRRFDGLRTFFGLYRQNKMGMIAFITLMAFIVVAIFGPMITNYNPQSFGDAESVLNSPTSSHILGTDDMGRDVLSALIYGSRSSLLVGLFGTFISMFVGSMIGVLAGYCGKLTDFLLMRFTDIMLVLPAMPLMLVLASLFGSSILNIVLVIGFTGWAQTARIIRSQTLMIKEKQYIERSHAIGASTLHIVFKHILPDVFPLICANAVTTAACAIDAETTLSFLGMGDITKPSWGMMLHYAFEAGAATNGAYWFLIPPGLCVLFIVLSFSYIGNSFDEIFNPKLRARQG